jgi:hypothetical protein
MDKEAPGEAAYRALVKEHDAALTASQEAFDAAAPPRARSDGRRA